MIETRRAESASIGDIILDFFCENRLDLEGLLDSLEMSRAHAKSLMSSAYKSFDSEPWLTKGLPSKLTSWLSAHASQHHDPSSDTDEPSSILISAYDGSVKFLFKMADGSEIESVLMPEKSRITICLSTQVGCAQGCIFCYTGKMGLKRNLSASEIVLQVVKVNRWIRANPQWLRELKLPLKQIVTNVVFMGMGEPLDNLDNVEKAISIMTDPWALNLPDRKITISTAGHLDGLKSALLRMPRISFALSLHATSDSERSRLMPINRRYPIHEVLSFLRDVSVDYEKDFLIQYTVIHQVNDSLEHARALVEMLKGIKVKVNLIPLNPIDPSRLDSPNPEQLEIFRDYIHRQGLRVMIRYSKGQDIQAACGQLVTQQKKHTHHASLKN